jgi:hypothetical protein
MALAPALPVRVNGLAHARRARPEPIDEDRLGTPQRLEPVDLDLEQPEGRVERIGRAGDTGLNAASASNAVSAVARSASGSCSTKVASGRADARSRAASPAGRRMPGLPGWRR